MQKIITYFREKKTGNATIEDKGKKGPLILHHNPDTVIGCKPHECRNHGHE
jgi:hypothetical protein